MKKTKATFVHASMFGSYTTPCKVLDYGDKECRVFYVDPWTDEKTTEMMPTSKLTFPKPKRKKVPQRYGYMDKIAFDWETGEALGGNVIYPSVEDLKRHVKCADECGIVKVKITLAKVVQPENRKRMIENAKKDTQAKSKARR
jgi:hypothetical protein